MTNSNTRGPQLPRRLPMSVLIGALLGAPAWALDPNALPTGGSIVAGSASIDTVGNQMTIAQHTQRLITEWQSFNIGSGAGVQFLQPSSSAVALARVLSNDASQVYGTLSANGHVFLVNPNGVYFAPGANVNVGGLVASALDITNEDFLAGRNRFTNGGNAGSVVNAGRIDASGGQVALVGAQVVNDGSILADGGSVALAAGDQVTLDFHGDRLLMVSVDQSALAAQAVNNGLIAADGGTVIMKAEARDALMNSVVNNSGMIRARSIGTRDGVVVLDGGSEGVVMHTGSIDVSGLATGEQGGTAKVLGDKVALTGEARIDARGDAGGGTVLVGGNYMGEGPERNASATVIGDRVEIEADAITFGHGGQVIVWADGTARFFGRISARGGAEGGNGGFVETSGKEILEAWGSVDAGASNGAAGSWLLDPRNVTIVAATANGGFDGGAPNIFTPTGDSATVDVATINNSLNGGTSVIITTGSDGTQFGDITLDSTATISKTAGGEATLSLIAARDINVNGKIISTGDKLHVVLNSAAGGGAGSVTIGAGAQVITNGGNITIGGGPDPSIGSARGGGVTTNGFRMLGGGSTQSTGALLSAGAGNILINAAGSTASGVTLQTAGFSTIMTTSGNITINGTAGGATSGINITTGNNTISSLSGNITLNGTGTTGNGITIGSGGTNVLASQSGNITLRGTTSGGTDLNIAPSTGAVRIGTHNDASVNHDLSYTGTAAGAILLEGDTLNLAPTGAGSVRVAGSGDLVIQPRSTATSMMIGSGGAGTLVLDAARLASIVNGFNSVTFGRSDGTGAVSFNPITFGSPLRIRGGTTTLASGNYVLNGGLDIWANGNLTVPVGAGVNLATGGADLRLAATGNVAFNNGTANSISTSGGLITIAARSADGASGFVDLRNTTLSSGGGHITIGGGSAPDTGYAIGSTVNGVRLGNTAITSAGGNIVINGESGSTAGVSLGVSSSTTIDAGAGNITVRGKSASGAGIALQSGTQSLSTTAGHINLIGESLSSHGVRIGSTTAGTIVNITTGGGSINVTGTGGDIGDGLNIGAGAVTLQTAGSGALNLSGLATGSGTGVNVFSSGSTDTSLVSTAGAINIHGNSVGGTGVSVGPTTTASGTTTSITTGSGNVTIAGTSTSTLSDKYGLNITANGTTAARGTTVIETQSGNIALSGTSTQNIGLRNSAGSAGDTIVRTVNGNISYTGAGTTAVSISPVLSTVTGSVGSGLIEATGTGNIAITGDQIVLHGSRVTMSGNGGTLRLQPLTPGTTVGFGSGTSGTLLFSDAELAAITGGFSTVYVGNASAGWVELGLTHPVANVVAQTGALPPGTPSEAAAREEVLQVGGSESVRLLPEGVVTLEQAHETITDAERIVSIVGPDGCVRGDVSGKCAPKRR